ncbi:Uncharacterised protein [Vibrio cholerae]|nr:Uncharacterised protein [Vibrio cholerae]
MRNFNQLFEEVFKAVRVKEVLNVSIGQFG